MLLGNVIRKWRRWKAEQTKLVYLFRFKRKLRRKSVSIYNSVNSDKSATVKEKNINSVIQLNANVT